MALYVFVYSDVSVWILTCNKWSIIFFIMQFSQFQIALRNSLLKRRKSRRWSIYWLCGVQLCCPFIFIASVSGCSLNAIWLVQLWHLMRGGPNMHVKYNSSWDESVRCEIIIRLWIFVECTVVGSALLQVMQAQSTLPADADCIEVMNSLSYRYSLLLPLVCTLSTCIVGVCDCVAVAVIQ